MEYDAFLELCRQRRSVRKYCNTKVDDKTILEIIEAGIQAPSPTNAQGWRFRVLDSPQTIEQVVEIVDRRLQERMCEDISELEKGLLSVYGRGFFLVMKNAPVVIAAYSQKPAELSRAFFCDGLNLYKGAGHYLSLGMVLQNMMLAAQTLGLSSCMLTGPLTAEEAIDERLIPPEGFELAAFLCLGYSDARPASPGRKEARTFLLDAADRQAPSGAPGSK
jgi:nitroreductase